MPAAPHMNFALTKPQVSDLDRTLPRSRHELSCVEHIPQAYVLCMRLRSTTHVGKSEEWQARKRPGINPLRAQEW